MYPINHLYCQPPRHVHNHHNEDSDTTFPSTPQRLGWEGVSLRKAVWHGWSSSKLGGRPDLLQTGQLISCFMLGNLRCNFPHCHLPDSVDCHCLDTLLLKPSPAWILTLTWASQRWPGMSTWTWAVTAGPCGSPAWVWQSWIHLLFLRTCLYSTTSVDMKHWRVLPSIETLFKKCCYF